MYRLVLHLQVKVYYIIFIVRNKKEISCYTFGKHKLFKDIKNEANNLYRKQTWNWI